MKKSDLIQNGERLDDLQYENLYIIQNPNLYCFTSDAVKLANFVKAKPSDKVVDLCSGSGLIGILVQAKCNVQNCVLVELQEQLANMSQRTIQYNNRQKYFDIINAPIQDVHKKIGDNFDIVVCNPPYRQPSNMQKSEKYEIAICKHEMTVSLEDIVKEASRLLKFGGKFYMVHKEDRLVDILCLCRQYKLEPKELVFDPSSSGAGQVLIRCNKGGRSGIKIDLYHDKY